MGAGPGMFVIVMPRRTPKDGSLIKEQFFSEKKSVTEGRTIQAGTSLDIEDLADLRRCDLVIPASHGQEESTLVFSHIGIFRMELSVSEIREIGHD